MADHPSSENVFTFSDVEFKIDGVGYNVASIGVMLQENAVPKIVVTIDPVYALNASPEPAINASFTLIKKLNDKFQAAARQRLPADLVLTVNRMGEPEQELALFDWVCVDAGFGTTSASGSISLKVTIAHPLIALDSTLSMLGNINEVGFSNKLLTALTGATDLVDALQKVLGVYATLQRTFGFANAVASGADQADPVDYGATSVVEGACAIGQQDITAVWQAVLNRIRRIQSVLNSNLLWDSTPGGGGDWPLQDCLPAEYMLGLQRSVAGYLQGADEYNILSLLTHTLSNDYQTVLVPTYTQDTLQLSPANYWGLPKLTVHEYEIADISLPTADIEPIAGIGMNFSERVRKNGCTWLRAMADDATAFTVADMSIYLAKAFITAANDATDWTNVAKIPMISPPAWFSYMREFSLESTETDIATLSDNGSTVGGNFGADAAAPSVNATDFVQDDATLKGVLQRVCAAVFRAQYKSAYQIKMHTRLMLINDESDTPGNAVIPGVVCRILTADGDIFYDMYVTDVEHTIDVASGTACTDITGAYVRSEGEYANIVATGCVNPLWSNPASSDQPIPLKS